MLDTGWDLFKKYFARHEIGIKDELIETILES